jgi:hypothetical protein
VAGRVRSTEKFNGLIGNRTCDLPACSYATVCPGHVYIQIFFFLLLIYNLHHFRVLSKCVVGSLYTDEIKMCFIPRIHISLLF